MSFLDEIAISAKKRAAESVEKEAALDYAIKGLSRRKRPLMRRKTGNTIIAEIKKSSPSTGTISDADAGKIAAEYANNGASCISVLTEPTYFNGSLDDLRAVKNAVGVPVMRKDFIVDVIQLKEAKAYGADGVLLIEKLVGKKLGELLSAATAMGLWTVVETHSKKEVESALAAGTKYLGVNNRDLDSMKLDLNATVDLCGLVPEDVFLVAESGVKTLDDINFLKTNCVRKPDAFLVGTSLMRSDDRAGLLRRLVDA